MVASENNLPASGDDLGGAALDIVLGQAERFGERGTPVFFEVQEELKRPRLLIPIDRAVGSLVTESACTCASCDAVGPLRADRSDGSVDTLAYRLLLGGEGDCTGRGQLDQCRLGIGLHHHVRWVMEQHSL